MPESLISVIQPYNETLLRTKRDELLVHLSTGYSQMQTQSLHSLSVFVENTGKG